MFDPNFKSTITDNNDITELKELVHTKFQKWTTERLEQLEANKQYLLLSLV